MLPRQTHLPNCRSIRLSEKHQHLIQMFHRQQHQQNILHLNNILENPPEWENPQLDQRITSTSSIWKIQRVLKKLKGILTEPDQWKLSWGPSKTIILGIWFNFPPGKTLIISTCVFKTKLTADGKVEKLKTRLVVRGFEQRYEIHYQDTFANKKNMADHQVCSDHSNKKAVEYQGISTSRQGLSTAYGGRGTHGIAIFKGWSSFAYQRNAISSEKLLNLFAC